MTNKQPAPVQCKPVVSSWV